MRFEALESVKVACRLLVPSLRRGNDAGEGPLGTNQLIFDLDERDSHFAIKCYEFRDGSSLIPEAIHFCKRIFVILK